MTIKQRPRIYFSVEDCFGKKIRTTKEYWQRIVDIKHPAMRGKENQVKKTLRQPNFVKVSKLDPAVFLYYRKSNKHHVCVVTRHEDSKGFIITAYITGRVAPGEKVWEA